MMDSFEDATDILGNLQPSDHEEDNLSLKQSESNDDLGVNFESNNTFTYNNTNSSDNSNNFQDNSKMNYNFDYKMENENNQNLSNSDNDNNSSRVDKNLDKSQLLTIFHFLKKFNLQATEDILLKETSSLINEEDLKSNFLKLHFN